MQPGLVTTPLSKLKLWLKDAQYTPKKLPPSPTSDLDPAASLVRLPEDLIFHLLKFLPLEDAVSLSRVCRILRCHSLSFHYWFPVLRTDNGRTPFACPPFTTLSTLSSESLRKLAVRAACIRSSILQPGRRLPLCHLDSYRLPHRFYFLCPPIPGTRLIVLGTPTVVKVWDYAEKYQVGESLHLGNPNWHDFQPVECPHLATCFALSPGICSFGVWSTRSTRPGGTELVIIRVQHDVAPAQVEIVRSVVIPWPLGYTPFTRDTFTVAFNASIVVVLTLTEQLGFFSMLVFSMHAPIESNEYRIIRTNISSDGIRNVSFNTSSNGDEFTLFVSDETHLRVYRYPTSVLEAHNKPQEPLNLPLSTLQLRTPLRHHHRGYWPKLIVGNASALPNHSSESFVEVMVNDQATCLSVLVDPSFDKEEEKEKTATTVTKERLFSLNATLTNSASGTTLLFHQRWCPYLVLMQCDAERGIVSSHELTLPYGGRFSKFRKLFDSLSKLDWCFAIDDAQGEVLFINGKTFFRLSYI